jgi:hypothetical protein
MVVVSIVGTILLNLFSPPLTRSCRKWGNRTSRGREASYDRAMAQVMLRAPLSELCGGGTTRSRAPPSARCSGGSSGRTRRSPAGCSTSRAGIREHVNVFVNGTTGRRGRRSRRRPRPRPARDHGRVRTHDRAAGGHEEGLFRLEGDGDGVRVTARGISRARASSTRCATRAPGGTSPRSPRGSTARDLGHRRPDRRVGAGRGRDASRRASEKALERLWVIVPGARRRRLYAGGDPGPLLREPRRRRDLGAQPRALGPPHAADWSPGERRPLPPHDRAVAGDPRAARRDLRASASGSPTTAARRGATRTPGIEPDYLPGGRARQPDPALRPRRAPRRRPPERLFMQFHGGVYRSDDARRELDRHRRRACRRTSASRSSSTPPTRQRLRDPADRREDRTTPDGACGLGDARRRRTWQAARRRASRTRPYLTILARGVRQRRRGRRASSSTSARRRARCSAPRTPGASWRQVADHLPPVYSVRTA